MATPNSMDDKTNAEENNITKEHTHPYLDHTSGRIPPNSADHQLQTTVHLGAPTTALTHVGAVFTHKCRTTKSLEFYAIKNVKKQKAYSCIKKKKERQRQLALPTPKRSENRF
jgi:hypothetical protein